MQPNVGSVDRGVRIILGAAIIGWGIYAQNWLGLIGIPLVLSGLIGQCFLYKLLGVSTCKMKSP